MPAGKIVVYGESIGGGPASHVATERACGGLVMQSTLSSLSSMAWEKFWWIPLSSVFTRGDFPNADRTARAAESMPVLVVHGTRDRVIPFSEGEAHGPLPPGVTFADILGGAP